MFYQSFVYSKQFLIFTKFDTHLMLSRYVHILLNIVAHLHSTVKAYSNFFSLTKSELKNKIKFK